MQNQTVTLPRKNVELMLDWLDGHYLKRPEFEVIRRLLVEQADTKTVDALAGLYAVATGQLTHVNMGSCPDILEGALVRDDECPACQLLLAADAQMREAGVTLPEFVAPATTGN